MAPTPSPGRVRWRVLDLESGSTLDLTGFRPSPEQATLFRYFDQSAASHPPWSPDERELLFCGSLADGLGGGRFAPTEPSGLYRIRATAGSVPTRIADGVIGGWSLRWSDE